MQECRNVYRHSIKSALRTHKFSLSPNNNVTIHDTFVFSSRFSLDWIVGWFTMHVFSTPQLWIDCCSFTQCWCTFATSIYIEIYTNIIIYKYTHFTRWINVGKWYKRNSTIQHCSIRNNFVCQLACVCRFLMNFKSNQLQDNWHFFGFIGQVAIKNELEDGKMK